MNGKNKSAGNGSRLGKKTKIALGIAAACGIYSAAGFWGVPAAIKWAVSGPVSETLGRTASIGSASFNPWTFELDASDIKLASSDGKGVDAGIGRIYANMSALSSITRFGVVVDRLEVERAAGRLEVDAAGASNFQDIADRLASGDEEKKDAKDDEKSDPFRFSLNNISLKDSEFLVKIPSRGVDEALTEINLDIPFIGSMGSDREINVQPYLSLKANGSRVEAKGRTLPFKDTLATALSFSIGDYSLPHLGEMLPIEADITGGRASVTADITFANPTKNSEGTVLIGFAASVSDFEMTARKDPEANRVAFSSLKVEGGLVDLLARRAEVDSVTLDAPEIAAERLESGEVVWAGIAGSADSGESSQSETAAENEKPFEWLVDSASITGGSVKWIDKAAGNASAEGTGISASAENITMTGNGTTPFSFRANILGGKIALDGEVDLSVIRGRAELSAEGLKLDSLSGYAAQAGAGFAGTLTSSISADFDLGGESPAASARGSANLSGASFSLAEESALDATLGSLDIADIDASYSKGAKLTISGLSLSSAALSLPGQDVSAELKSFTADPLSLVWDEETGNAEAEIGPLSLDGAAFKAAENEGKAGSLKTGKAVFSYAGKTGSAEGSLGMIAVEGISFNAAEASGGVARAAVDGVSFSLDGSASSMKALVGSFTVDEASANAGEGGISAALKSLKLESAALSQGGDGLEATLEVLTAEGASTTGSVTASVASLKASGAHASQGESGLGANLAELSVGSASAAANGVTASVDSIKASDVRLSQEASASNIALSLSSADITGVKANADGETKAAASVSSVAANGLTASIDGGAAAVALSSLTVNGTDVESGPIKASTGTVSASSLTLEAAEAVKAALGSISAGDAKMTLEGDFPVNVALGNATASGARASFDSGAVSVDVSSAALSKIDGKADLFDFGVGSVNVSSVSFASSGEDMSVKTASVKADGIENEMSVNAARLRTNAAAAGANGIEWKSGADGLARLDSAEVTNIAASINDGKVRFATVQSVATKSVKAPARGTIEIGSVTITKPQSRVSRKASGELDIDPLLGKRESAEEAKAVREKVKEKVAAIKEKAGVEQQQPIRVGEFKVVDGRVNFTDNVISPAGSMRVTGFNASVKPVAIGGADTPSALTANALINGVSKLNVTGSGSPMTEKGKLVAKASITSASMPYFSPYTIHYVSYPIQKGNLTITSDVTLTDRTILDVKNHTLIEQLEWGEYQPNDTSTSLPVTLATSLLKNSKGNIEFDLPISGDVSDPNFSVSDIVLTALKNLIIKIVAAPVNIVGSIFTLGGLATAEAPSTFIPYLSGASSMTDDQMSGTLGQIVAGLKENPAAKLEITAVASPSGDEQALRQRDYANLIKRTEAALPQKSRSRKNAVDKLFSERFPGEKASLPQKDKEAKLYETVKADAQSLAKLADRRSRTLAEALEKAGVAKDRIFVTASEIDEKSALGGVKLKVTGNTAAAAAGNAASAK